MNRGWSFAAAAVPVILILGGGGFHAQTETAVAATVNVGALPALAREQLPTLEEQRQSACPELPLVWIIAQVQAESSWNARAYSPAGAAGLLQMMPGTWVEASGGEGWSVQAGPPDVHPVWDPSAHLTTALPWVCANLRLATQHLAVSGKPTEPLDALAVYHIAGCSRVTDSATGIPAPGEAGCDASCAQAVDDYIEAIHRWARAYSQPVPVGMPPPGGAPAPYPGAATGCVVPDPTGTGGCVTGATAWLVQQVAPVFPTVPVSCWDAHAWNPESDHPQGRACDYTFGQIGAFPGEAETARGWQLAEWLRTHAAALRISYLIWQGRIWSTARSDQGWRPYGGGGVYDPTDPTGGHYDHIHVSLKE